jgi:hypothetical protein
MPLQNALPTWLAVNNANFTSPSGMSDPITGFPYEGGGLIAGNFFDLTNDEAANASYTTNGTLYAGRYRFVLVDSGANAANIKTGTVGFIRSGNSVGNVRGVVITNAGTGQTAGTYSIAATVGSGGGSGAIIQIIVGSGGTITSATVVNGGFGYNSVPTFSLTAIGGSSGAVVAQLNTSPNVVTSADQVAIGTSIAVRPVVFLNAATPGNYTFIQELGTATVLGKSSISGAAAGAYVNAVASDNGLVTSTVATGSPIGSTIGQALDTPEPSLLFKVQLGYAAMVVQD